MRQAINNLQSTFSGFGFVSGDNVFKVCDQPHPLVIQAAIKSCLKGDVDPALEKLKELWDQGYAAVDIVVTLFRVVKTYDECVYSRFLKSALVTRPGRGCCSELGSQSADGVFIG
jgi:replication factor C subunit 2/4